MTDPQHLSPARIAELRGLCEAATPGPWSHMYDANEVVRWWDDYGNTPVADVEFERARTEAEGVANAAFIAAARTALPEALDALEAVTRERDGALIRSNAYYARAKGAEADRDRLEAENTALRAAVAEREALRQQYQDERDAALAEVQALHNAKRVIGIGMSDKAWPDVGQCSTCGEFLEHGHTCVGVVPVKHEGGVR